MCCVTLPWLAIDDTVQVQQLDSADQVRFNLDSEEARCGPEGFCVLQLDAVHYFRSGWID